MIGKFAEKTIDAFIENSIISEENKELYVYGLYQGIIILLNLATSFLIGMLLGMIWQTFVYLLCYIPLRTYAGGYHAKTQAGCYILSTGMQVLSLWLIKYTVFYVWMPVVVVLTSGILLFLLAPVESENKPFDDTEIIKYKKIARNIWLVEVICLAAAACSGFFELSQCMIISISFFSIFLVVGKIKIQFIRKP